MHLFRTLIILATLVSLIPVTFAQNADEKTPTAPSPLPPNDPSNLWATPKPRANVVEQKIWSYAAGLNCSWSRRLDYGNIYFYRFEPEISGFMYSPLPIERLWLRHGVRLGYSNDQPQMPQAVRLQETDWKASIEEGIIYNSIVAMSLTAGLGYDWRKITAKTTSPITVQDSRLNSSELFLWSYLQAGFGVSALAGKYMFEPIVRWQHLTSDSRTNWAYGLEMTAAW